MCESNLPPGRHMACPIHGRGRVSTDPPSTLPTASSRKASSTALRSNYMADPPAQVGLISPGDPSKKPAPPLAVRSPPPARSYMLAIIPFPLPGIPDRETLTPLLPVSRHRFSLAPSSSSVLLALLPEGTYKVVPKTRDASHTRTARAASSSPRRRRYLTLRYALRAPGQLITDYQHVWI